ncbi:unnamed protein product [Phytophthora fragariaefolia]|uniref:Unnamed protein product n=1 Tax=Phytophthora fragariaefolia TaxID=1490495 RepID=A0A9W6XM03_9STRA|nr:unnamed protein product [Phytophthora fragariaefolia]
MLVTFTTDPSPASQNSIVVCARFEPSRIVRFWPSSLAGAPGSEDQSKSHERKLHPGEVVSLPVGLLPSGNRKAKQTTWIRADREGNAKQTTKVRLLHGCVGSGMDPVLRLISVMCATSSREERDVVCTEQPPIP